MGISGVAAAHDAVFSRRGWLSKQPASFRSDILSRGRLQQFERGQPVYHEGDPGGGLFGILSGGIGVEVGSPRMIPRTAHVLRAGDWFGSGPIVRGGARSIGFKAVETTALLAVPLVSLRSMGLDEAEVARRAGDISEMGVRLGADVAADLLIPASAKRVAAVLLRVTAAAEGVAPEHPDGFLLPQSMLAELANVSRSLANRIVMEWRAAGWIDGRYNRIRVLDAAALAAFAFSDD